MKKWFLLAAVCVLAACGQVNKKTVNYQMSLFDQSRYYVVAGEGADKEAAGADALKNMQRAFEGAAQLASTQQLKDIMANVKVQKVWKEPNSRPKNYFALAVLDRNVAQNMLAAPMDVLDAKLAGFAQSLSSVEEPFAALKLAFNMQPLVAQRNVYQDAYAFINAGQEGYRTQEFDQYKAALKNAMGAVKVSIKTKGPQHTVLLSKITDALNQMGLGVALDREAKAPLSVVVQTDVDGYESEKVKGLEWCSSMASVSMVDETLGVTFARFDVHDRAGTSRRVDSLRLSMQGVGEKAAEQISQRMYAYLKIR